MEWLIFSFFVVAIGLYLWRRKAEPSREFPYETRNALFTPAERSFYGVLRQAANDSAVVFGKVRVADVLTPTKGLGRSEWQKAFNQISGKHFDYVLCRPDDLSVMSAVELDDSSHAQSHRIERDIFIDRICESAVLKLYRFKAGIGYSITGLREILFPAGDMVVGSPEQKISTGVDKEKNELYEQHVLCPKCSSQLVRKVARKGEHKGKAFLACSAYPNCRYIEKLGLRL